MQGTLHIAPGCFSLGLQVAELHAALQAERSAKQELTQALEVSQRQAQQRQSEADAFRKVRPCQQLPQPLVALPTTFIKLKRELHGAHPRASGCSGSW